jgi:hypothetical protein
MKPFKTKSKPILKNVAIKWYGEIILKILKKTHKVHKNKSPTAYFTYVPIGHKKNRQTTPVSRARSS